jgi:DNA-binding MarR family transcriptional regulator
MGMDMKIIKRGERVLKGGANKNRLRILDFVATKDFTSVWVISQGLKINFANASQHLQRLEKAGLIQKSHSGLEVYHELTPYGEKILEFIERLD